ncbi:COMM domain-containing protein 10 [Rhipicephalus microplus]|uniref:Putative comm domain-containing protein ovary overexpressed n=1 Tax=Rhipicephalus microplus TaxID=6941 RepID=A0A6M2D5F0_RHIMP|nr:COMM domain-containing protein 10-like [Rhipicephalus microplus]
MTVSMFTKTVRLEQAVKLINQLDDAKFSALLARILQKLPCKDERSFTEEEEQKLQRAFNCDAQEVTLLLESLSFIFEQAAFHLAKPQVLRTQLTDLGMEENKVQCMVQSWTSHAKQLVEQLKQRSLAPRQLQNVDWEVQVRTAQQSAARSKRLQALVDLVVSTGAAHDHLLLQFSHGQLFNLYTQLEQIQVQLDSLI